MISIATIATLKDTLAGDLRALGSIGRFESALGGGGGERGCQQEIAEELGHLAAIGRH